MNLSKYFRRVSVMLTNPSRSIPSSELSNLNSRFGNPDTIRVSLRSTMKAISKNVKNCDRYGKKEAQYLAKHNRISKGKNSFPFEQWVASFFAQEVSILRTLMGGLLALLLAEIALLKKEYQEWQQSRADRIAAIEEKYQASIDRAQEKAMIGKENLQAKRSELERRIASGREVQHSFATAWGFNPDMCPERSLSRRIIFVFSFIVIAFAEMVFNIQAFQIYKDNMVMTVISVLAFSITIPLIAHFLAEALKRLRSKFSTWDALLAITTLAFPIGLSFIIGLIRSAFLGETGQHIPVANWLTLGYFNVFIFVAATLVSYFLHEKEGSRTMRRLISDNVQLEKKHEKVLEDITKNEDKLSEEIFSLKETRLQAIEQMNEEEQVLKRQVFDKIKDYNAFAEDLNTASRALEDGHHQVISTFRSVLYRSLPDKDEIDFEALVKPTFPSVPPVIPLDLNTSLLPEVSYSSPLRSPASANGLPAVPHSFKTMGLGLLLALFVAGCQGGCQLGLTWEQGGEPDKEIVIMIDDSDGKQYPPERFAFDDLDIDQISGCILKAGLLGASSDVKLETVRLNKSNWNSNRFLEEERLAAFRSTVGQLLDSLYQRADGNVTRTSDLWQPIARTLCKLAASPAQHKLMILASDMIEHSAIADMYKIRDPNVLSRALDKELGDCDLSGIQIHILPPSGMKEHRRKFCRYFWETYLRSKGAQVKWEAKLEI